MEGGEAQGEGLFEVGIRGIWGGKESFEARRIGGVDHGVEVEQSRVQNFSLFLPLGIEA